MTRRRATPAATCARCTSTPTSSRATPSGSITLASREPEKVALFEYQLPGGWVVLAGRTDQANETLSLRLVAAGDLWFHIRGMPGSHVVLRVPQGQSPDRATRELAAAIAAYHSKARGAGTVAVSCTEGRHVSKPKGAPTGTVNIQKETVLKVKPLAESAIVEYRRGPRLPPA